MNYTDPFYRNRDETTRYAANAILTKVLNVVPSVKSALDVGCGVGTWLDVVKTDFAIDKVLGIEGPWVPAKDFLLNENELMEVDLSKNVFDISEHFDLSICLEVAEHLPVSQGPQLIEKICKYSDFALFSAAMPGQPGVDHVNCQWPDYWAELFNKNGFGCIDLVRFELWDDDKIPYWYKQNTMLYYNRSKAEGIQVEITDTPPISVVHPDLYAYYRQPFIKRIVRNFVKRKSTTG